MENDKISNIQITSMEEIKVIFIYFNFYTRTSLPYDIIIIYIDS